MDRVRHDDSSLSEAPSIDGPAISRRVSSPLATGAAGEFFEQHVGAYLLALLLTQGFPPIFTTCTVSEVSFQTEHLGWHADDFLLVSEDGSGEPHKLIGQVKRTVTVSSRNDDFRGVISDFWLDFVDSTRFSIEKDRFALVTFRGTNVLLGDFCGLLDCARVARSADEFEHSLGTQGFLSKKAVRYGEEVRSILDDVEGRAVPTERVWCFLRVLYVLSLDFTASASQTEPNVRYLLAHTTNVEERVKGAEESWTALLREAGEGMQRARRYRREDLPEGLRSLHSPIGGREHRILQSLRAHSHLVLDGICSTIGDGFHLKRSGLVQQVLDSLWSRQVVLISGSAGSGKSSLAKGALDVLSPDHFAFAFRAEGLAVSHLDQFLHGNQIPCNGDTLRSILAGQARKVLLVDSVERLLEAPIRDALGDLLRLAARDASWQVIITCREYSVDLIRSAFIDTSGLSCATVQVKPLGDGELEAVETAYPGLKLPLTQKNLRQFLRNPYYLGKALQVDWTSERSLPLSERGLRDCIWRQVVQGDRHMARGMAQLRGRALMEIALKRARALSPYAACYDLDPEVTDSLLHDSLAISSPDTSTMLAPAHDVLEDWAVLKWIDEQYAKCEGSVEDFSVALGTCPALRRAYREWMSELTERDTEAADHLFRSIFQESGLSAQFRDDTLVSMMRSPSSVSFLRRHSTTLFSDDKRLLHTVVRQLRVACVTAPAPLDDSMGFPTMFGVPSGSAWDCVLRIVEDNLEQFTVHDRDLLLGLVEDWARGVQWNNPYPDGAESAAAISYWLLPYFPDYMASDWLKRTLKIISKIPKADPDRFIALLDRGRSGRRDIVAETLLEIVFESIDGTPMCRDMPDEFITRARKYLLCSEDEIGDGLDNWHAWETDTPFGIRSERSLGFFPASAYRGSYLPLLRHHPLKGLSLVLSVMNDSADWYANPRVAGHRIEAPHKLTLTFADGTSKEQWCSAQFWNLYRGTSVGPNVIQCLLMALERWLWEIGTSDPDRLDAILISILRCSDSVALTAVVASMATAFPIHCGETLLALLSSRDCIALDRRRYVAESWTLSRLPFLQLRTKHEIYYQERNEMDGLPHRQRHLEHAIVQLQYGPFAERVHALIDQLRSRMRPVEEQDEGDRVWRLALHRMDVRQYVVDEKARRSESSPGDRRYVHLALKEPESDIRQMVDEGAAQAKLFGARDRVFAWGVAVFRHEDEQKYVPALWPELLEEARSLDWSPDTTQGFVVESGGPGFVAAVCIRDHWDEMSFDQREWCVGTVCSNVERTADNWDRTARVQRNGLEGDRPCAWILPKLFEKRLVPAHHHRIREAFVAAVTHANVEVREHIAWGIGEHLWKVDRDLTLRCLGIWADEAILVHQSYESGSARVPGGDFVGQIEEEAAKIMRRRFFEGEQATSGGYDKMDYTGWFVAEANARSLIVLSHAPTEPLAILGFTQAAQTLVAWWKADERRRRGVTRDNPMRGDRAESILTELLLSFLLQVTAEEGAAIISPIVGAVDEHPDDVRWFILGLIEAEDRTPNPARFWFLWGLFARNVRGALWLDGIDEKNSRGSNMISAIFLGAPWKDEIRHWRSLEGYADRVHSLFEGLPAASTILESYLRFLYHIGEQGLPEAFVRIARRLQQGDPVKMLSKDNTVFMLEALLQQHVYRSPRELKRQREMRESIMVLLDLLVERGSSSAFWMRDDFVTPLPMA